MSTYTIMNKEIREEDLPDFTRQLFKNRQKDRRSSEVKEIQKTKKIFGTPFVTLRKIKLAKKLVADIHNKEVEAKKEILKKLNSVIYKAKQFDWTSEDIKYALKREIFF